MQAFGVVGAFSRTPTEYYEDLASPLHLTKLTTYITQTIIGDSIIVRSFSELRVRVPTFFL